MKKIINGRMYNTDTAKRIGEWEDGFPTDFNYVCETLYVKRNGEHFVHGEGGPASRYAESAGQNSWRGGERIIPMSYDSAREWAEEHLSADEYEAAFGEVSEDGGEAVISVRVPASVRAQLDRYCAKTGRQKGEVVAELIATLA